MVRRAREQDGFLLMELLVALAVLTIGILALVGVFISGIVTIRRAAQISTAAAIADRQMESFRDLQFASVGLLSSTIPASNGTSVKYAYRHDAAFSATQVTVSSCAVTNLCNATQSITGPDRRSYELDTYVVYNSSSAFASNTVKTVTIVVRDPKNLNGRTLIRETTDFSAGFG